MCAFLSCVLLILPETVAELIVKGDCLRSIAAAMLGCLDYEMVQERGASALLALCNAGSSENRGGMAMCACVYVGGGGGGGGGVDGGGLSPVTNCLYLTCSAVWSKWWSIQSSLHAVRV